MKGFIELNERKTGVDGVSREFKHLLNVKHIISVESYSNNSNAYMLFDSKYEEPIQIYTREPYDEIIKMMNEAIE